MNPNKLNQILLVTRITETYKKAIKKCKLLTYNDMVNYIEINTLHRGICYFVVSISYTKEYKNYSFDHKSLRKFAKSFDSNISDIGHFYNIPIWLETKAEIEYSLQKRYVLLEAYLEHLKEL